VKEVHFFDLHFGKGLPWYFAQFPEHGQAQITGEASPYYIFHPQVSQRIKKALPGVKLIVLLRNPVDRAYSHYQHQLRLGVEKLPFEMALQAESGRIEGEEQKLHRDGDYYSFNHQHFSYQARGIYVDQLKRWSDLFADEEILTIRSEDFFDNPSVVLQSVTEFLGIRNLGLQTEKRHNALSYSEMNPSTKAQLKEVFCLHNQRLYEYLGRDMKWEE
jgi:hypothetical protein